VFVAELEKHDRNWKRISMAIPTRTTMQVRTHAQKHFLALQRSGRAVKRRKHSQSSSWSDNQDPPRLASTSIGDEDYHNSSRDSLAFSGASSDSLSSVMTVTTQRGVSPLMWDADGDRCWDKMMQCCLAYDDDDGDDDGEAKGAF
jgi:hypothetical protein